MFGIVVMVIETELSWGLYSKVGAAVSLYTFEQKEYVGSKRERVGERERERVGEREMVVVGRGVCSIISNT